MVKFLGTNFYSYQDLYRIKDFTKEKIRKDLLMYNVVLELEMNNLSLKFLLSYPIIIRFLSLLLAFFIGVTACRFLRRKVDR